MTRVKGARIKRIKHKKILKLAKGYRGSRSSLVRTAKEAVMHAGAYAYAGRKQRKRQKRTEWIVAINAALKEHDLPYKKFINLLKIKQILIDRKILTKIINEDKPTFDYIVEEAKK